MVLGVKSLRTTRTTPLQHRSNHTEHLSNRISTHIPFHCRCEFC